MKLYINPKKKRINTLTIFLSLIRLFSLMAMGKEIPIIKRKAGNTKSARVMPFHCLCTSHQGDPSILPR